MVSRRAWFGAAIYLVFGGLWIFFSDALLASLVADAEALSRYQTWKGWCYVVLTALLAAWLLRRAAAADGARLAAEQRTLALVRNAPVGIARLAPDGRFLMANPRLCALLGRDEAALLATRLAELAPTGVDDSDGGSLARLFAGSLDHCQWEWHLARPDGSAAWLLLSAMRVRPAGRATAHLVLVVQDIGDFKTTQAALQASERRLRELIDSIPDAITVRGIDGRYQVANRETARIMGIDAERMLGRTVDDIYPPHTRERVREREAPVLATGASVRRQVHFANLQGEEIALDIRLSPLTDAAGRVTGVITVGRDVTEALRIRQALERSETSLRLALEGSGGGLWDWSLKDGEAAFSDTFRRLLRYGAHDPGGEFARELRLRHRLHPEDRRRVLASVRQAVRQGGAFAETFRLRGFDGQERWYSARGMRHLDGAGQPDRFSGVLTDLTERRRAEERDRLAAAVVDNTIEGVLVTDAEGRIRSVNPAFTRLLGYGEAELLGRTPALLKSGRHGAEFYAAMWAEVRRTGHWQGEIWNRRKNGEVFPELMSLSAVADERGRVTHYVGLYSDISLQKASEAKLDYLAHHDPLTGLPNRLLFQGRLEQALREAERDGERLAVLLLDLDRFKDVNDSYGHLVGDELLQHVAQGLSGRLRHADTLARLGGDEFALLMRGVGHQEDAARLAGELMAVMAQPWRTADGLDVTAGVSVGICLFPEQGRTAAALLQGADAALYRAKGDGRGAYRYFADEMTTAARERLELEARLRRALAQEQLCLHYQPQVALASGDIIGAEALVRWRDPAEGLIGPARFIAVAEATGLIAGIGAWVLREACRQGRRWLDAGLPLRTLAVNVSPRQFYLGDMAAQVTAVLAETGFPPERLELELTEGTLMEREQEALRVLEDLRQLGVRVAIDDFGTGYSSLAYLKRFPLDLLKIDRSFIADIPGDADDMAISAAIIALARSLGVKVLAEGVETEAQLAFLQAQGCDFYQGYLRSPPLPAEAFEALWQDTAHQPS